MDLGEEEQINPRHQERRSLSKRRKSREGHNEWYYQEQWAVQEERRRRAEEARERTRKAREEQHRRKEKRDGDMEWMDRSNSSEGVKKSAPQMKNDNETRNAKKKT